MYQTNKLFVTPQVSMTELISENPSLLVLLEHFDTDCVVHDDSVHEFCTHHNIPENVFILFANIYNGIIPTALPEFSNEDCMVMIRFLAQSHVYYKTQKYPEIESYIIQLSEYNKAPEIPLIQKFYYQYVAEVNEHLEYENTTAFPFFMSLLHTQETTEASNKFSALEYKEHHTDIECKLSELKQLLLKHVPIQNDRILRRKILVSLFELEQDLHMHSLIEEVILTPVMHAIEKKRSHVKK